MSPIHLSSNLMPKKQNKTKLLSPICASHMHKCGVLHWVMENLSMAHISNESDSPFLGSCQLQLAPELGVRLQEPFSFLHLNFSSCNLVAVLWAPVWWKPYHEAGLSHHFSPSSSCFIVSAVSSEMCPEPWGVETLSSLVFIGPKSGIQAAEGEKTPVAIAGVSARPGVLE